jgi:hypothetical protein
MPAGFLSALLGNSTAMVVYRRPSCHTEVRQPRSAPVRESQISMSKVSHPILRQPRIGELLKLLGGKVVTVKVAPPNMTLPAGNSYWNVAALVARIGGRMRLGWKVSHRPQLLFWAEHHAVWEAPDGVMQDVTVIESLCGSTDYILFVPDESVRINLEKMPNVTSRYLVLREDPRLTEYFNAYESQHRLGEKLGDLQYRLGYRCEAQFAMAEGLGYVGFKVSGQDSKLSMRWMLNTSRRCSACEKRTRR